MDFFVLTYDSALMAPLNSLPLNYSTQLETAAAYCNHLLVHCNKTTGRKAKTSKEQAMEFMTSSYHVPDFNHVLLSCCFRFLSRRCDGIDFSALDDSRRSGIFDLLAHEFASRRARITRHLIGEEALQEINHERATTAAGDSEHELLYRALTRWYKSDRRPTGCKLYTAFKLAGCEDGLLGKFHTLLQLTVSSWEFFANTLQLCYSYS